MHLPRLSQLQSRLVASVTASVVIVVLFLIVSQPQIAYAADSIPPEDHNHLLLRGLSDVRDRDLEGVLQDQLSRATYEADFRGVDRGIVGRATDDAATALANNAAKNLNIKPGDTDLYVFPKEALTGPKTPVPSGLPPLAGSNWTSNFVKLEDQAQPDQNEGRKELRRRQGGSGDTHTLYISLNTCQQPTSADSDGNKLPPPLKIYVSTQSSNQNPGPDAPSDQQESKGAEGGFASFAVDASDDTYITIEAPSSEGFNDVYNYDLAASIDAPFHSYDPTHSNLGPIDSDTNATLLITANLTDTNNQNNTVYEQWAKHPPPFMLFVNPEDDPITTSLQSSYCAMKNYALFASYPDGKNSEAVNTSMTNTYLPPSVKQQFYVNKLNGSTSYSVSLAMFGNSTVDGNGIIGGGGKIWKTVNFKTKSDANCRVIYDLPFCTSVAYAVPGNPNISSSSLSDLYDDAAAGMYKNFSKALAQVPCKTGSSAQYSLAKNCTDCEVAYKSWLCAVTIPRCDDYSSNAAGLVPRNIDRPFINGSSPPPPADSDEVAVEARQATYSESSRNPMIDKEIMPGPYKELLPCREQCYSMVRACPNMLQFGCPSGLELDRSYGKGVTCNALDGLLQSGGSRRVDSGDLKSRRRRLMGIGMVMLSMTVLSL